MRRLVRRTLPGLWGGLAKGEPDLVVIPGRCETASPEPKNTDRAELAPTARAYRTPGFMGSRFRRAFSGMTTVVRAPSCPANASAFMGRARQRASLELALIPGSLLWGSRPNGNTG